MHVSRIIAQGYTTLRHVDLRLPARGVIVFKGENGAGKSNTMSIPGYTVFGETGKDGQYGAAAIDEHAAPDQQFAQTRTEFEHEGKLFGWIERHVTRRSFKLDGELGGRPLVGDTPSDKQEDLIRRLGFDYKMWATALHFNSGFKFLRTRDAGKKAVLDALTGLHRIEDARGRCKDRHAIVWAELQKTIADLGALRAERRAGAHRLLSDVNAARMISAADSQRAAGFAAKAEEYKRAAAEAQQRRTVKYGELQAQEARVATVRALHDKLAEEAGLDPRPRLADMEQRLARAQQAEHGARAHKHGAETGVCPACTRPGMDPARMAYFDGLVEQTSNEVVSLANAIEGVKQGVAAWAETSARAQQAAALLVRVQATRDQLAADDRGLASIVDDNQRLASEMHRAAQDASLPQQAVQVDLRMLRENRKKLVTYAFGARTRGEKDQHATALAFWRDVGFARTGVKAYMLDRFYPALNSALAHASTELSGGRLSLALAPQTFNQDGQAKDEIGVVVSNQLGSQDYRFNSAGECAKYDLAVMAAFFAHLHGCATLPLDTMILDECFEHIDPRALGAAAGFVRFLGQDRQVWLSAHQEELTDGFEYQIIATNSGNGTVLTTNGEERRTEAA